MFLSVVIPAYNESPNIASVLAEVVKCITACSQVTQHEIIVVDDHSDDGTFQAVKNSGIEGVSIVRLSRRSGSHTSLRAGLKRTKGDITLCISADGQDNPAVLEEMISKISQGFHTVWALRISREEPLLGKLFSGLFYKLLRWVTRQKAEINLANADFYLLSRKVVDSINSCEEKNTSLFGLIIWLGFNQGFVQYHRRERISGKSKWNFKSRTRLAKDWIIAFSGLPLKLITYLGIIFSILGFSYATFLFFYALYGYSRPGWAESVIITLISDGFRMIMLGVIGEYLWRTLDETRKRPLYFIEEESHSG
jgi:glycosyltransferase involved in cell wall biosynthesis